MRFGPGACDLRDFVGSAVDCIGRDDPGERLKPVVRIVNGGGEVTRLAGNGSHGVFRASVHQDLGEGHLPHARIVDAMGQLDGDGRRRDGGCQAVKSASAELRSYSL